MIFWKLKYWYNLALLSITTFLYEYFYRILLQFHLFVPKKKSSVNQSIVWGCPPSWKALNELNYIVTLKTGRYYTKEKPWQKQMIDTRREN